MKKKQPSFFDEPELLRGNSCSFFAVIVLLVLMLVIVIISLFYIRVSSGNFSINNPISKKSEQVKPINQKIGDYKSDDKIEIKIEQSELTTFIQAVPDFPLKKPQAKITPENIILSGKSGDSFFSLAVQVYLKPIISETKLLWEVTSIRTGDVVAPKQLSDKISKSLLPENFLPGGDQVVVERADLFDGYLLVVGVEK